MATAIEVRPQQGPQQDALACSADVLIYGGAAGGGKSWALLLEPLRHIRNPDFGAVIFRRTSPQITNEGGLWDESSKLYPLLGARPRQNDLDWRFPSGAKVKFAHLEYEKNVHDWQGSQIPLIGFDELTHFTEKQFWYLLSRSRSTCGVKPYLRATTNPDADSWVAKLIEWWIDEETGYPIPERAGVVRWFVRENEELHWADTREELEERFPKNRPKSFTFIPAKLEDNPALLNADPGYLANLLAQPLVDRERLLGGNWKIKPAAGKVFNRTWFEIVDSVPDGGEEVLGWDFASTEKELAKDDPDFTACMSIRRVNGLFYITFAEQAQLGPGAVEGRFESTSRRRAREVEGKTRFRVRFELEPGSAAKREAPRLVRLLTGLDVSSIRPQGDKLVRARALAAQAEGGNVKMLRGAWNTMVLNHLHGQPDLPHDDLMDAGSTAFNDLIGAVPRRTHSSSRSTIG